MMVAILLGGPIASRYDQALLARGVLAGPHGGRTNPRYGRSRASPRLYRTWYKEYVVDDMALCRSVHLCGRRAPSIVTAAVSPVGQDAAEVRQRVDDAVEPAAPGSSPTPSSSARKGGHK